MLVVALLPMLARLALIPVFPVPEPLFADEFGHLLIGDTFAAGRLATAPHPMGAHFESIYVIQRPSYASYYPVGQGLLLAIPILFGLNPWLGVWLSIGLMCATIYWMLQGWMPSRWALLGALLTGFRLSVLSHWMNSFWGGAVPAIGGALVIGALPRILRRGRPQDSVLLGVGLSILGQTRPYEGLLLSLPVGIVILVWLFRTRTVTWRWRTVNVILPLCAVLSCFLLFTAYYNFRVTGNPVELPYQLYQARYGVPQSFIFQPVLPPGASSELPELQANYDAQVMAHNRSGSWPAMVTELLVKAQRLWTFYFQPVWTFPLLFLPWFCNRRYWFLVATAIFVVLGIALYPFFYPHYLAPACGIVIALVVRSIRWLRVTEWRGRAVGSGLAFGIVLVSAMGLLISPAGADVMAPGGVYSNTPRSRIVKKLEQTGGKHLILVQYGPTHAFHYGMVNNGADIDASRVVWARDLGPARNDELIRYYPDRTVWTYDPDVFPINLVAYPVQPSAR
jgi:hypothetical protein